MSLTINSLFSIDYVYRYQVFDRPLRSNGIKILLIQPIVKILFRVYFYLSLPVARSTLFHMLIFCFIC
ncbi:hypothetical protein PEC302107_06360 [Pectobacterium araliae]|nr:hypothetical protein PEC302107_06360 [Pectobacterium carotovorum subsp. carotovorum]